VDETHLRAALRSTPILGPWCLWERLNRAIHNLSKTTQPVEKVPKWLAQCSGTSHRG